MPKRVWAVLQKRKDKRQRDLDRAATNATTNRNSQTASGSGAAGSGDTSIRRIKEMPDFVKSSPKRVCAYIEADHELLRKVRPAADDGKALPFPDVASAKKRPAFPAASGEGDDECVYGKAVADLRPGSQLAYVFLGRANEIREEEKGLGRMRKLQRVALVEELGAKQ